MKQLPLNKVIRLHNTRCPYCGVEIERENKSKEHVVGRRFVPKGKLDQHWNLHVNSCVPCNNTKSDLEDDISAITMQPDPVGGYAHEDQDAIAEANKRAQKTYSRRTSKLVVHSSENIDVSAPFNETVTAKFGFTSPPQVDPERAYHLARMQLAAFFHLITWKEDLKTGYWWPGVYAPMVVANRRDWGNELLVGFADEVMNWLPRFAGTTAHGFFKHIIKKHPSADCWSWAFEWNQTTRVIGFAGDKDTIQETYARLPQPQWEVLQKSPKEMTRYRIEIPLDEADDKMFHYETEEE